MSAAVWPLAFVTQLSRLQLQAANAVCHGADAITSGVPVSVLDDEYTQATRKLGSTIQQYAAIDLYNPDRAKVQLSF